MGMNVGKKGRRGRRAMGEINVVPYIDVMLVLLVIFMVTAPLLHLGVDVQLPKSNAKALNQKADPVIVSVRKDGSLALTKPGGTPQPMDDEELKKQVSAIVNNNNAIQVVVGADEHVDYGRVYEAMTLLQSAGAVKIGLMSQPKESARKP